MKITKATVNRLNKSELCSTLDVIGNILQRANVLLGNWKEYSINEGDDYIQAPIFLSDGTREFISGTTSGEYEKRVVRGLCTLYPNLISGTFSNGLNGVQIYDINKLVRLIANNPT